MPHADPRPAPPPRPSIRRAFFAVPDIRGRWAAALRAGLAFAIPAAALYLVGFERDALLAALGGFAALYGEKRPYRATPCSFCLSLRKPNIKGDRALRALGTRWHAHRKVKRAKHVRCKGYS